MINAKVENNKVKTDVMSKIKDKIQKLVSKFKAVCPSTIEDYSASNQSMLVADIFNSLVNPTSIQHLKSSINCARSGDSKTKECEIAQCIKTLTTLYFTKKYQLLFLIIIMMIRSLKILGIAMLNGNALKKVCPAMMATFVNIKHGIQT